MAEHYPEDESIEAINAFKEIYWSPEDQKKYLIRQLCIDTRKVKAPITFPRWSNSGYEISPESDHLNGSFKGTFMNKRITVEIHWKGYRTWLFSNTLAFSPHDTQGKSSVITGTITEQFPLSPEIAAKNPNAEPIPRVSEFKFINSVLVKGDWISFIDVYAGMAYYR